MAKIDLDKYYTPLEISKHCIDVTFSKISNISEIIEPSAGNGSFSLQLENCLAYDLEPEHETIIKQDFLELNLEYKKDRLFIGNPPFRKGTLLSNKFTKKCFKYGDFVAFILPICQFNNNIELYEFDLIYSEDLGVINYSNIPVKCCFNIYQRPKFGINKKVKLYFLNDIVIKEVIKEVRKSRNQFLPKDFQYDIGICKWGSVGNIIENVGTYEQEMYIKILNEEYKSQIIHLVKNIDWKNFVYTNKSPTISQWMIRKYLKEQIPNLK